MAEISVPLWAEKIISIHTDVTDAVSHVARLKSDRYFVWWESDRDDFIADGKHKEKKIIGYTDLYTKIEFDPWCDAFETSIDNAEGVAWKYDSTDYDEDTKMWRYSWKWELAMNG